MSSRLANILADIHAKTQDAMAKKYRFFQCDTFSASINMTIAVSKANRIDSYEFKRELAMQRELRKPLQVDEGVLPRWFQKKLKYLFLPKGERGHGSEWLAFSLLKNQLKTYWIDHYGTIKYGNTEVFVSEPYPDAFSGETIDEIDRLAKMMGCRWMLSSDSWHCPTRTIRIVIYQSQKSKTR